MRTFVVRSPSTPVRATGRREVHVQLLRWPVLGLGVLSVLLWSASYSWLVGLTPPLHCLSRGSSPWLIAEAAAAVTGALAVLGGLLVVRSSAAGPRRTAIWAVALGAVAMVLSVLSIAWPA
jgi:hypothetical protein